MLNNMGFSRHRYTVLFLSLMSVLILCLLFKMIDYLAANGYVQECFTNNIIEERYNGSTSHTVDLPLTTRYSCQNFCGPTARCAISGQQCFTDIDCPGCQAPKKKGSKMSGCGVPGDNDAGKLTVGVTPRYSPLTSGYGTQEKRVNQNWDARAPQANFGVDTWGESFNQSQLLYNKRYKTPQLELMPQYPLHYTSTGMFVIDGPLPSNY
jgi:hypothetical protein